MRVVGFAEADTPPGLRRQAVAIQDAAFGADEPSGLAPWHDPALQPWSLLLVDDDGTVLATLEILAKRLAHAGADLDARGLSAVATHPAHRGRGHGLRLVRHAHDLIRDGGADLAIFTCDRPLAAFYAAAGYAVVPGAVLVGGTPDEPFPSDAPGFDKVVMAAFHSDAARAVAPAFAGARIGLYPGTIDRLW